MNYNQNPYGMYNPYMNNVNLNNQGLKLERVSDLEGAKKYPLQPNQIAYLLDEEEPIIYMKQLDNTGKGVLRGFQMTEIDLNKITDKRYVSKEDFDLFKADILATIKDLNKGE